MTTDTSVSDHVHIVAEQLTATHGAVKMLHTRVRLILDYLKSVRAGNTTPHAIFIILLYRRVSNEQCCTS